MFKNHPYLSATIVAILLASFVWLCIPKEYTAITKVADEYKEMDLSIGLDNMKARVREAMGGANKGLNDIEVYCKTLKTEDFARGIAHKQISGKQMTYGEYLREKDTIETILDHINYNYSTKQQTLTIGFSDRYPIIAAQMLDSVTTQLQAIITRYRHYLAEEQLKNAKDHQEVAKSKYEQAQRAYADFQDSHFNPTTKAEIQRTTRLEKEVDLAYKDLKNATKDYVRQQALLQRSYLSFAVVTANEVPTQPNSYFISYLISFIFIALVGVRGYKLYKQRQQNHDFKIDWGGLFSPWALTLLLWIGLLGSYYILDTDLYPITNQFYNCFAIWIPIFCFCSWLAYNLIPASNEVQKQPSMIQYNRPIFIFFLIVSAIITPIYIYQIMQIVMMFSTDNLMNNIRTLAIFGDGQGFLNHANVINQALFIVALWTYPRTPKWVVILTFLACMLCALAIMEKGTMFFLFACLIFVLYERGVIKLRSIFVSGFLIIFLFYLFNILRTTNDDYDASDDTLIDFLSMYILSPPVAFCQLSPELTPQFGTNTFEMVYRMLVRFGVSGIIEKQKLQEFVFVPISTNVYTIFQPFYIDFGYKGIAFFAMLYGILCGWFYRLFRNKSAIGTCIYTFLFQILTLQFYQENLFLSLIFTFEIALYMYLMCTKHFSFQPLTRRSQ